MKNKIIYIAPSESSFVKNDVTMLSKHFPVITNFYDWSNKILTPFFMVGQFFFVLRHFYVTKTIFISFGGYWSFVPTIMGKLFGINVFIILNGTDSASIPKINYGSLRKFPLNWFCKQSYRFATKLLPVSESLILTKNKYFLEGESSNQGIQHFFPKIKTQKQVIHNGIDVEFWKPVDSICREPKTFLSVLSGDNQFLLKGGDLIAELANKFPNCKFYIIGVENPSHLKSITTNLFYIKRLAREELHEYYNRAQFYFQLSIFEGFGVALAEAMACECIPIGSSVNNIPEIIGDSGFILEKRNLSDLETLVKTVLTIENKEELQKKARKRIVENYTIKKREELLLSLLEK